MYVTIQHNARAILFSAFDQAIHNHAQSIFKNLAAPDPVRRAREAQRSNSRTDPIYKSRAALMKS